MFACRGLLNGQLIYGRAGGFALGACSQVLGSGSGVHVRLDYVSHRGIMVAHISTSKTAPTAAIGLNWFGGRQVVLCCLLRLNSGACIGAGSCATCVTLQLANDLWAVR